MPIVTIPDVLAGIKAHWEADRTLVGLVPGGLHFGRVPLKLEREITFPYALLAVAESPPQWNSSSNHIQVFGIKLSVWAENGNAPAKQIISAIDLRFDRGTASDAIWVGDRVLDLVPQPGELSLDETTREAQDEVIAVRAWELWVQASH